VGEGRFFVSSILDLLPSFLPFCMLYGGPPACSNYQVYLNHCNKNKQFFFFFFFFYNLFITKNTASLAVIARISEQETTPGHCFSSCFFAALITSYPRKLRFAGESFSAVLSFVESIRIDPSHPYSAKTTKY